MNYLIGLKKHYFHQLMMYKELLDQNQLLMYQVNLQQQIQKKKVDGEHG